MIRRPVSKRTHIILVASSIVTCVLLYSWMSHRQKVKNPKDTTIPNATQFVEGVKKIATEDAAGDVWLLDDVYATGSRLLLGLSAGFLLSVVVGVMMGTWKPSDSFLRPPIALLASIPPTAMMAVYFVLFGTEMKMFVAMIALGISPTLIIAIATAADKDVDDHTIYKAYTLGASHGEAIWNVVFKAILPRIIQNMELMIGPAMVFLIAAEWATADVGFGYRLRIQSRLLNMNVVYTYLLVLGLSGFSMRYGLLLLRRKLCPWFGE